MFNRNGKKVALGYDSYERPLVGIALLITGQNEFRLVLQDKDKTFKNGKTEFRGALEDLPVQPRIKANDQQGKLYRIRMSSDGLRVDSIGPVKGRFKAIVVDFSRPRKDADPAPYEVPNKFEEGATYKEFWVSYQITEGYFKDVILPAFKMHYKLEEDPNNPGFTKFVGNPENKKATRLAQLINWGVIYDIWSEPIMWADDGNVLPEVAQRVFDNNLEVYVDVDEGYIKDVTGGQDYDYYDDSDDEDVDDAFPTPKAKVAPKKAVKPAPAKAKVPVKSVTKKKQAPVRKPGKPASKKRF